MYPEASGNSSHSHPLMTTSDPLRFMLLRDREFTIKTRELIDKELGRYYSHCFLHVLAWFLGLFYLRNPIGIVMLIFGSTSIFFQWTSTNIVLWRRASKLLDELTADEKFDVYLERFPFELKETTTYKAIRRNHFELGCYRLPIKRAVLRKHSW